MKAITIVFPYFMNLGMLSEQRAIISSYPRHIREHLHVIVVDDCSPKDHRPSRKHVGMDVASVRLYRLTQKKRWNWLACRNLGAAKATTDWLLLTDIDHGVPVETLERLVGGDLDPRVAYRFSRVDAPRRWPYSLDDCTAYKPHNDSWLLTRQLFYFDDGEKFVCGYDERLSGCYGTSGEFRDRVNAVARSVVTLPEVLIRYPREIISDASTSPKLYTRKNDPRNDSDLQDRKIQRSRIDNWRPLHHLIPAIELYSSMTNAEVVA